MVLPNVEVQRRGQSYMARRYAGRQKKGGAAGRRPISAAVRKNGHRWLESGRRSGGGNVWGSPGRWATTGRAEQGSSEIPISSAWGKRSWPVLGTRELKPFFPAFLS